MSKFSLDKSGDVLYIIFDENSNCYSEELGDGIYARYDIETNYLVGITITEFQKRIEGDEK